ncbi:MAG: MerR family transcriptional regulator [Flavobacteriales bacterium]|nr:MerR family transcriptional regulator [Flavobacteriales bacterium]
MSIKNSFSIKDLENLTGVKAHTIRIWEKRYNLLEPERSDSNIRTYNLQNLRKILNIAVLNKSGVKISKIADISEEELNHKVKDITLENKENSVAVNNFKIAMLNFDQSLFEETYNKLLACNSFRDVFLKEFLILLTDIGNLWTTNTISPAHERFISTLIKQKILINIERVQNVNPRDDMTYILYLPMNEIHDIGVLYVHFELMLKGYKSVFLGPSVPLENLYELQHVFENITYISYFTVEPVVDRVYDYLNEMNNNILSKRNEPMHILGNNTKGLDKNKIPNNVKVHDSIIDLIDVL